MLEGLADQVIVADQVNPAKWSLSLYPKCVFLNFGGMFVGGFCKSLLVVVDDHVYDRLALDLASDLRRWDRFAFARLPQTRWVEVPFSEVARYRPLIPELQHRILEKADEKWSVLRSLSRRVHAPAMLRLLRDETGRPGIPDPPWQPSS